jgi:hypothetical protein
VFTYLSRDTLQYIVSLLVGVEGANSQVFGHNTALHCLDHRGFEGIAEFLEFSVLVKLGSVKKTYE